MLLNTLWCPDDPKFYFRTVLQMLLNTLWCPTEKKSIIMTFVDRPPLYPSNCMILVNQIRCTKIRRSKIWAHVVCHHQNPSNIIEKEKTEICWSMAPPELVKQHWKGARLKDCDWWRHRNLSSTIEKSIGLKDCDWWHHRNSSSNIGKVLDWRIVIGDATEIRQASLKKYWVERLWLVAPPKFVKQHWKKYEAETLWLAAPTKFIKQHWKTILGWEIVIGGATEIRQASLKTVLDSIMLIGGAIAMCATA